MNDKAKVLTATSKLVLSLFAIVFISSCAQTDIIVQEDTVEQLQNLDDYDRDGVIEAREKCDGTVLGATIDNYGCGSQTSKVEPLNIDIKFENNSYVIPGLAYKKIEELAEFLNKHQESHVRIEGHTSNVGDADMNQVLSKNRARAVASILANDFNISTDRVSSVGYGFEKLEENGDSPEAHAFNRRITAELTHIEYVNDMKWTIYSVVEAL
jgi:outer membrane protein OmpA-like peptidoglycan-associated protein